VFRNYSRKQQATFLNDLISEHFQQKPRDYICSGCKNMVSQKRAVFIQPPCTLFELVIIILYHFSQPVCIVISLFLLINDVRMTTFTHQLLSRKTSTPEV